MQTKNKILLKSLVALCCMLLPISAVADDAKQQPATVKKERNAINSGNKLYNDKKYAEAEVQYRKALEANPNSEIAQFNLASSLIKQDKPQPTMQQAVGEQQLSEPMQEAVGLLQKLADTSTSKKLAGKASYDLGNIAYHQQNFAEAINHYKQALRKNPDNNDARYNLRLAQLKKQQQDQNKDKNNQDKNKDNKNQNKDKNQDQNKDKDKQNQDKKDQQKQDQDKKDQQKQDQDKKDQNKQDQQKQQQQQPKDGISKQNMDRILQTMQDKERETQKKMNQQKAQMQRSERARTRNKW